ncbi:MAG: ABC transporter substrate-binding protein, partial [Pannonibacter sp.]
MENTTVAATAPFAGPAAGSFAPRAASPGALRRMVQRLAGLLTAASLLTGCMGSTMGTAPDGLQTLPATPSTPAVTGQTIGNGTVRVGLLLPLSAGGSATAIATTFRNSAELALKDFQGSDIQLLVKDTAGTAEGGRAAAQSAISEGAELLLGPVFAPAVGGAASVARTSGVPIVAFSTDTSVAGPGVYLLSFLPAGDVRRIIGYAATQNRKS